MKKLFSALFAVVFALTVSGFALASDNAEKAPEKAEMKTEKADKAADAKKMKAEKAADAKKAKAGKKAVMKDEMNKDNTAPAAEKPGVPSTQTPPKPKGN